MRHLPPIQIQYFDGWISAIVALFIGLFMVLYTGDDGFGKAIRDWDFYKAAGPSCLVAYIVLNLVSRSFKQLDVSHPWYARPLMRTALQLYHGVIIPSLVLMGFFAIYFIEREAPDAIPRYYHIDYPFAVVMVLAVNVIYLNYFMQKSRSARRAIRNWWEAQAASMAADGIGKLPPWQRRKGLGAGPRRLLLAVKSVVIPKRKRGRPVRGILEHVDKEKFQQEAKVDVACYDNSGLKESVWEYRMDGTREFNMKLSVMDLYELLDRQQFFEYDQFKLVNRDAIAEPYKEGIYWYLPLKMRFTVDGRNQARVLKVTKRRGKEFEAWWFGVPTDSD